MDKRGVGKTTMAAVIAVRLVQKVWMFTFTSDPAAHLTNTFDQQLLNLTVSCIDLQEETEHIYFKHLGVKIWANNTA